MNPIRKLLRTAGTYTIANVVNALVPFLILPLITAAVGTDDYGIYGVYKAVVNLVVPFTGLVISRSVARAFVADDLDISRYITSAMALSTGATVAVVLATLLFHEPLGERIGFPPDWIVVAVLASFFQTQLSLLLATVQMQHRPAAFGGVRVSQSLINGGLTLTLVLALDMQWRGLVLGHAAALALYYPVSLLILRKARLLDLRVVRAYAVDAFKYGAPLIPHVIAGVVITMSDRVLLASMLTLGDAGVYSASYEVGMAMFLVITSVNQAFMPWLFGQLADEERAQKRAIVAGTYAYFGGLLALAGVGYFVAPPFIGVYLGADFQAAGELLPWIVLAFAFHGMFVTQSNYLYFSKRTGFLSTASAVAALTNIGLNLVLIPRYGVFGAAWASSVAFLAALALTWWFGQRLIPMPWLTFWKKPGPGQRLGEGL